MWARDNINCLAFAAVEKLPFFDESRLGLTNDSRCMMIWRQGRAAQLTFATEVLPFQGGTETFWGGII